MLLKNVRFTKKQFQDYRNIIDDQLFDETIRLSKQLRGKRVLYINSNQNRGGVYEYLSNLVPLLNNLNIKVEWKAITEVPADFYQVTKMLYNGIQGIEHNFTKNEWKTYEEFNRRIAKELEDKSWDFVLIQDHQMLGVVSQLKKRGKTKWIWRSHSETHNPSKKLVVQLRKYLELYNGIIFHLPEYVIKGLHSRKVITSTMAVDPLSTKNKKLAL